MAQIKRDENGIKVLAGVSSVDGVTPINVVVDSVSERVLVKQMASGAHGSITNRAIARRDANYVPSALVVSSSDGALLAPVIESNNLRLKND